MGTVLTMKAKPKQNKTKKPPKVLFFKEKKLAVSNLLCVKKALS